jgi:hypothetical protein
MQTEKDAEIVGWIGRIGAAGVDHVMARLWKGPAYEDLHWARGQPQTLARVLHDHAD